MELVESIIKAIFELGYNKRYFETDDGLVWTEAGELQWV